MTPVRDNTTIDETTPWFSVLQTSISLLSAKALEFHFIYTKSSPDACRTEVIGCLSFLIVLHAWNKLYRQV